MVTGTVTTSGNITGPLNRSNIITETGIYELPPTTWRVWDDMDSLLPGTATIDDLGLTTGAFGTNAPYIASEDLNGDTTAASYARRTYTLPPEYVSGGTITLRFYAGIAVGGGAASVDAVVYQESKTSIAITGSDLCTTAATSITTTFGAKDFTITPTGRVAGDTLDIRIAVIGTTSVTAGTIAQIPNIEMVLQIKG